MGSSSSGHHGRQAPAEPDVCRSCGVVAYPGEMFCVSCGAYQGWDTAGEAPAARPAPTRTESVRPDPLSAQQPAAPAPPTAQPEPVTTGDAYDIAYGPSPESAHRAGWPTAPAPPHVVRDEGASRTTPPQEETQLLQAPETGRPHLLPCPECRSSNAESRTYCHPCGALLRPVPEPPAPTWWERLRKEYLERPDVWHADCRWAVLLAALPLCAAAGVAVGGAPAAAQRAVPVVKDRFMSHYAVAPTSVSASDAAKGFTASHASDGLDNKAWAPKATGEGAIGAYWAAAFQTPFRLTSLVIVNGASTTPAEFFESGRPTKITASMTTTDRGEVRKEITLADHPGQQRFHLGIDNVVAVEIRIEAVHPGLKPEMPVAIAEIQFFSRRES